MHILVVEDDDGVRQFIAKGFTEKGDTVTQADNGRDGQFLATSETFDVIILDRMLPQLDGLTILKGLRGAGVATPVLILSALGDVDSRVEGLRAGGDDYLVKPFAFSELQARAEILARRTASAAPQTETKVKVGDLTVDLLARKVTRGGQTIDLQGREFRLLSYLLQHQGQVVTRTMLLENVWDYHFDPQTNIIDVHISRLRGKIDKGHDHQLLRTVRGAGYVLGE